ncbi:MAG: hypothetical protein GF317_02735 [Candidatus Lokiarchaeota archaeon]|nr:hypothetical protein [Candidatus Lokiarchaeota archaeon]MBD3198823.1 hypothetical protein [Candidatus Lokiarchaeota archaeon]
MDLLPNIINLIGYSGSGKTFLVERLIKKFKDELNLNSCVIKNIHEHKIDTEGKDTSRYINSGAKFSITKNVFDETAIITKSKLSVYKIINWVEKGPFEVDIFFTEGFRDLHEPTILCIKDPLNIDKQMNNSVKMISGLFIKNSEYKMKKFSLPVLNIEENWKLLLNFLMI